MIMGYAVPKAIQIFIWDEGSSPIRAVVSRLQDIVQHSMVQPVCNILMRSTLGLLYK